MLTLALSALGFHFVMLFINCNPVSGQNSRVYYWSQYYAYPYFQQTWTLFAPPPECNYNLIAQYENNGKQSTDVITELLSKHQNRLKGYEPLLISIINSTHYFEKNSPLQKSVNGPVTNDVNFNILYKIVLNYLQNSREVKIENLKLTLLVSNIKNNQKKIYYN